MKNWFKTSMTLPNLSKGSQAAAGNGRSVEVEVMDDRGKQVKCLYAERGSQRGFTTDCNVMYWRYAND